MIGIVFAVLAGLTPPDVELTLYDERLERVPLDEPADLVAITVETYTARRAYQIAQHYLDRYEWSRGMSPFNAGLHLTRNTEDARVTVAFGQRFERTVTGITAAPVGDDRDRMLIEEFGYSESVVATLPPDDPSPVPSKS